jgi:cytochrome c
MKSLQPNRRSAGFVVALLALSITRSGFAAIDPVAAEALLRKNGCFKCHAVDKKKDGPSYREVAKKYKDKDKGEAETRLVTHITTGEKAKFPDGHEEDHKIIKTKDMEEIRNGIKWILSQ